LQRGQTEQVDSMGSTFAKNAKEKATAETIARGVNGVKSVKNEIAVRP